MSTIQPVKKAAATPAVYAPDHPEVAATINNLGTSWRELGQPDTARKLYELAIRIYAAHLPPG